VVNKRNGKVKITNDGKYIAQLNAMFLDVYGTKETPKELNITVRSSDDSSVCDALCGMAEHAYYDSANRCKKCNEVVQVDLKRRSNLQKRHPE